MLIAAVLFDLDGVLIDSEGIYTEFWGEMDRRYPTGVPDFTRQIKGSTLPVILARYFPDEDVQRQVRVALERQEREMRYRLFPGALDLLEGLRGQGVRTAIVTSSNRKKMDNLFAQLPDLARLADLVVTDEDVTESKPSPQGYLLAAERLGVRPEDCAVVEDSLAGLRAARASGATVIGLTTTNRPDAVRPLADITLGSVAEIGGVINFHNGKP